MSSYYNNDTLIEQDILITELRQQLAEAQADRDAIKKEWEKAYEIGMLAKQQLASCQAALADTESLEIGTGERLAKVEQQLASSQAVIDGLNGRFAKDQERIARQAETLAAALAACQQKDEALKWLMDWQVKHVDVWDNPAFDNAEEALAIQPDDSALKAWLGDPTGEWKKVDGANYIKIVWHLDYVAKEGDKLYSPKGLK